jgi:carboxymethylenebutenolidase
VIESERDVPTQDGAMNTFFASLALPARKPAVIVLMDAPGIREALRDIARTIADDGYLAVLPNLYYRSHRAFAIGPTREHPDAAKNRELIGKMVATLSNAKVASDVGSLLDFLERETLAPSGRAGVVGYCMSGAFAVAAAAAYPERIACAASYFGTRLVTEADDSPHRLAAKVRGELYFAFAEHDPFVAPEQVERLREAMSSLGRPWKIESYPGTEHGFVFRDRGTHHAEGAIRHWNTLRGLLARNLG